jgi:hypothetical protein
MLPAMLSPAWGRGSCPANAAEKELVEHGFQLLAKHLGLGRLKEAIVIEPTPAFFPDRYDGSLAAAERMFFRACGYMGVNPDSVRLTFWQDNPEIPLPVGLMGQRSTRGAAGFYAQDDQLDLVSLNVAELKDPEGMVSTMSHELAHHVLLKKCGLSRDEPHMEAVTDLATIYLGFGILLSNTLLRRHGWISGNMEGWSVHRKGYISPEMAGWGLSLFAWVRGESDPRWSAHLATDGKSYLKRGLRYLHRTSDSSFPDAATIRALRE